MKTVKGEKQGTVSEGSEAIAARIERNRRASSAEGREVDRVRTLAFILRLMRADL